MSKNRRTLLLIANAFLLISTLILTLRGVLRGAGKGQLGNSMIGLGYFKAFTIDSNVLNGVISFMIIKSIIKERLNKHFRLTRDLVLWQFVAASATGLTLFVTATFLSPMLSMTGRSYFISFYKDMFFFHFLNPVLTGILFVYSYQDYLFDKKEIRLALIPTVVYSSIYFVLVSFKLWPDFYGVSFGGKIWAMPIVFTIICLVNYWICKALIYFHNRYVKKAVL